MFNRCKTFKQLIENSSKKHAKRVPNSIRNYTNIKQTPLSQHLSLLKDRELVESRREGSYVFYRLLNPKVMDIFAMTHDM